MRNVRALIALVVATASLQPLMEWLWLQHGTTNPNFVQNQALAFNVAMGLVLAEALQAVVRVTEAQADVAARGGLEEPLPPVSESAEEEALPLDEAVQPVDSAELEYSVRRRKPVSQSGNGTQAEG